MPKITRKMKNLVSTSDTKDVTISKENAENILYLPFNKKEVNFMNTDEYIRFIKSVEGLIRKSKEYRAYIAYLKEMVGLKNCVVFGNIDDSKASIEMHHGPIFTLFDYVEITVTHLFKQRQSVNSFRVAELILKDHFSNLIQVVMLSEAVHKAFHSTKKTQGFFISTDSAWGDLVGYLKKYSDCLNYVHINKIKRYLNEYEKNSKTNTDISGVFKEFIKKWEI